MINSQKCAKRKTLNAQNHDRTVFCVLRIGPTTRARRHESTSGFRHTMNTP